MIVVSMIISVINCVKFVMKIIHLANLEQDTMNNFIYVKTNSIFANKNVKRIIVTNFVNIIMDMSKMNSFFIIV